MGFYFLQAFFFSFFFLTATQTFIKGEREYKKKKKRAEEEKVQGHYVFPDTNYMITPTQKDSLLTPCK